MHMPVGSMLKCMSLNELNHWMIFHKLERESFEKEKQEIESKRDSSKKEPISEKKDISEMSEEEVKAMFGI